MISYIIASKAAEHMAKAAPQIVKVSTNIVRQVPVPFPTYPLPTRMPMPVVHTTAKVVCKVLKAVAKSRGL